MDERDCKYSACSVTFKRFLDLVDAAGIKTHIMAGIIPLKAAGMAKYMNENVLGIEMAAEMIARIHDEHLCDGVHIMAIGAEKNVPTILDKAGIRI